MVRLLSWSLYEAEVFSQAVWVVKWEVAWAEEWERQQVELAEALR